LKFSFCIYVNEEFAKKKDKLFLGGLFIQMKDLLEADFQIVPLFVVRKLRIQVLEGQSKTSKTN